MIFLRKKWRWHEKSRQAGEQKKEVHHDFGVCPAAGGETHFNFNPIGVALSMKAARQQIKGGRPRKLPVPSGPM